MTIAATNSTSTTAIALRLLRRITGKTTKGQPTGTSEGIDPVSYCLSTDQGIYRQNPAADPFPDWRPKQDPRTKRYSKKYERDRREIKTADVVTHMTTLDHSLHVRGKRTAAIQEVVLEIDHKQPAGAAADALAHYQSVDLVERIEEQFPELQSFHIDRSRHGAGAYARCRINRTNYTNLQFVVGMKVYAELIKRSFPNPPKGTNSPQFDDIMGLPDLELANPKYDEYSANEDVVVYPDNEHFQPKTRTRLEIYEHEKRSYRGKWDGRREELEPYIIQQTSNAAPAPCNYYPGADITLAGLTTRVNAYIDARNNATLIPMAAIMARIGIKTPAKLRRLDKAIKRHTNKQDGRIDFTSLTVEWFDGVSMKTSKPAAAGSTQHMAGIWSAINSPDKLAQARGIAFLTLHETAGEPDLTLALQLYTQHVPNQGHEDNDRRNRLRSALRFAARTFNPNKQSGNSKGIRKSIDEKVTAKETQLKRLISDADLAAFNRPHITFDGCHNGYWKPQTYLTHHTLAHFIEASEYLASGGYLATAKLSELMTLAGHSYNGAAIKAATTLAARLGIFICLDEHYWFRAGEHSGQCRRWDFNFNNTYHELKTPDHSQLLPKEEYFGFALNPQTHRYVKQWLLKNAKPKANSGLLSANVDNHGQFSQAGSNPLGVSNQSVILNKGEDSLFIVHNRLFGSDAKTATAHPPTCSLPRGIPPIKDILPPPDKWFLMQCEIRMMQLGMN